MAEAPPTDSTWLQAFFNAIKHIASEDTEDFPQGKDTLITRLTLLLQTGSIQQKKQLYDLLKSLSLEQKKQLDDLLKTMPLEQQKQLRALQKAMPLAQAATSTQNSFNEIPPIKTENPIPILNNKSSEQLRIEAERAKLDETFNILPKQQEAPTPGGYQDLKKLDDERKAASPDAAERERIRDETFRATFSPEELAAQDKKDADLLQKQQEAARIAEGRLEGEAAAEKRGVTPGVSTPAFENAQGKAPSLQQQVPAEPTATPDPKKPSTPPIDSPKPSTPGLR